MPYLTIVCSVKEDNGDLRLKTRIAVLKNLDVEKNDVKLDRGAAEMLLLRKSKHLGL